MEENGGTISEINENFVIGDIRIGILEGNLDKGINTVSHAIELIKDIPSCK